MKIYFSDFFNIAPKLLEDYGAFNISLINDLPLFIDPFLLFNSEKDEYQQLHEQIIEYIRFLRDASATGDLSEGLIKSWFMFPEVKQNWFGYSMIGNSGSGLGIKFANALNSNLNAIFDDFGAEKVTRGSHLEKLCLVRDGVGRDNVSDFTTNLIKGFLLEYTETFATQNNNDAFLRRHTVDRVTFNKDTRTWVRKSFLLPTIDGDFVLLTPKDILTKDEAWINKNDLIADFSDIADAIPNDELRAQINQYFSGLIPIIKPTKKEVREAATKTILKYPILIDHYIRRKEDDGESAVNISSSKVLETNQMFVDQLKPFSNQLASDTKFYELAENSFEAASQRVEFLKNVIEDNDGYRIFYYNGLPIQREADLQIMFRLVWFASPFEADAEVNNGRGPVDYKISRGSGDKSLVEFKLASNSKLKQNLANQVEVYKAANRTDSAIKVIIYFSEAELSRVLRVMKELAISEGPNLVLIDARRDNKPSASNA